MSLVAYVSIPNRDLGSLKRKNKGEEDRVKGVSIPNRDLGSLKQECAVVVHANWIVSIPNRDLGSLKLLFQRRPLRPPLFQSLIGI